MGVVGIIRVLPSAKNTEPLRAVKARAPAALGCAPPCAHARHLVASVQSFRNNSLRA